MHGKKQTASRKNQLLGRWVVGLWVTAAVWLVALLFYVMVTERYFQDPLAGLLIFLPGTMIVAAILLQNWRKNWPGNKTNFFTALVIWGIAWVSMLIKTFWN